MGSCQRGGLGCCGCLIKAYIIIYLIKVISIKYSKINTNKY